MGQTLNKRFIVKSLTVYFSVFCTIVRIEFKYAILRAYIVSRSLGAGLRFAAKTLVLALHIFKQNLTIKTSFGSIAQRMSRIC